MINCYQKKREQFGRIREWLADLNLEVILSAFTGQEAIELIYRYKPEVIILDLHLPDGCSLELVPQIRQIIPHSPIIVLSNVGSEFYRKYCLKLDIQVLDKSLEINQLVGLIQQARSRIMNVCHPSGN